jgi:hypothetical protein
MGREAGIGGANAGRRYAASGPHRYALLLT